MDKKIIIELKDGDIKINGEPYDQCCWDADAVGCAVASWLRENNYN